MQLKRLKNVIKHGLFKSGRILKNILLTTVYSAPFKVGVWATFA